MAKHSGLANTRGGKRPVKPQVVRTPARPPQPPVRQPNISRRPIRQPGR